MHEGGGRWAGSSKVVELKKKVPGLIPQQVQETVIKTLRGSSSVTRPPLGPRVWAELLATAQGAWQHGLQEAVSAQGGPAGLSRRSRVPDVWTAASFQGVDLSA